MEIHKVLHPVLCEFGGGDVGEGGLHAASVGGGHEVSRNHLVELSEGEVDREGIKTDGFEPGHEDGVVDCELCCFFRLWLWRVETLGWSM